jgi:hypothetical protein
LGERQYVTIGAGENATEYPLEDIQKAMIGRFFLAPWDASPELLSAMDRHIQSRQWPVLRERCLKAVKDG